MNEYRYLSSTVIFILHCLALTSLFFKYKPNKKN